MLINLNKKIHFPWLEYRSFGNHLAPIADDAINRCRSRCLIVKTHIVNQQQWKNRKIKFFKLIGLSLSVLFSLFLSTMIAPSKASASGFAVYPRGAEGLAMQHNVIAHTEGPNSNYYNPALITELKPCIPGICNDEISIKP